MAKKSNKTEHVLRLITADGGKDTGNDRDNTPDQISDKASEKTFDASGEVSDHNLDTSLGNVPEVVASVKEPRNKDLTYETKLKIEIQPEISMKPTNPVLSKLPISSNPEGEALMEDTSFQVEQQSKHKPVESAFIEEHSHLVNLAEILAFEKVESIMTRMGVCDCATCKNDILALALNSLPSKYVTSDSGKQYFQLQVYRKQFETDVLSALARACVRVKASPRHEEGR